MAGLRLHYGLKLRRGHLVGHDFSSTLQEDRI